MSKTIVQINFTFNMPVADYIAMASQAAEAVAAVQGMQWKIWILNEETQEAGGIYLFENSAVTRAYVQGPIITQLRRYPAIANFSVKFFHVVEEGTKITRGPIGISEASLAA